ncbi:hypothetical protein KEM55_005062 [Ascosphaera atra]|nr:hypothetical protein KEM55_005062 [Ascosphaera atra]
MSSEADSKHYRHSQLFTHAPSSPASRIPKLTGTARGSSHGEGVGVGGGRRKNERHTDRRAPLNDGARRSVSSRSSGSSLPPPLFKPSCDMSTANNDNEAFNPEVTETHIDLDIGTRDSTAVRDKEGESSILTEENDCPPLIDTSITDTTDSHDIPCHPVEDVSITRAPSASWGADLYAEDCSSVYGINDKANPATKQPHHYYPKEWPSFSDVSINSSITSTTHSALSNRSQHRTVTPSMTGGMSSRMSTTRIEEEYPLVLLHCTLLPPSLSLTNGVGLPSEKILKDVLPEKYWRRWKLLEDKVVSSGVLRERGLLIPHPEGEYGLLEERLLESLELTASSSSLSSGNHNDEKARRKAAGSKDGGGSSTPTSDSGRKWEVRVYAANGLMRAGAWAAAWREMEKVDVEISVALPVGIKRELERRVIEEANAASMQARSTSASPSPHAFIPGNGQHTPFPGEDGVSPVSAFAATAAPQRTGFGTAAGQVVEGGDYFAGSEQVVGGGSNADALEANKNRQQLPEQVARQRTFVSAIIGDVKNIALLVLSLLVAYLAMLVVRGK